MNDFPIDTIREDFPLLKAQVNKTRLVYFDNAATTQKPVQVIDTIDNLYRNQNSSIHRSVNYLSGKMTEAYEGARETVRRFVHANNSREIIFTAGATASINLVATSFGEAFIEEGDEVLVSAMEHHSNIVPWQLLCDRKKARLKVLPVNDIGELQMDQLPILLTERTRLIAVTQVSNAMGVINPVNEIIRQAHEKNIPVLIDGAQSIQHGQINVQEMDCDFYVFSGHKVYGPTGIGVLYGKEKWLEAMPPYQGGGDMIDRVSFSGTSFNVLPFKFEAGTTNYVGAIALGAALEYIEHIGLDHIDAYEIALNDYAGNALRSIPGIRIFGDSKMKHPIFSFLLENIHPYDAGMVLDKLGIAIRTGTHCAMPLMEHFGIDGTIRASMCFYNTKEEVDRFVEGINTVQEMFG
ncbi:MAG: cysteine desulfurase [Bacteroidetes bacterium]|jgi:cysteine desulfurase / selenocysteine lyase|nr:cysteine desulfurase [Bacteroidota bacterium]MBT4398727.1 cysteine desulfurase [Bacteroidota bacterium]MBT4411674.1 cysteine desulfurase [Bacteroidota bacterium]MBT5424867.1 cysteine desulfurase [Bacteroidota bacterium]MBT7091672.1 cysteine desulfurase [Bacteroidota bacterium]